MGRSPYLRPITGLPNGPAEIRKYMARPLKLGDSRKLCDSTARLAKDETCEHYACASKIERAAFYGSGKWRKQTTERVPPPASFVIAARAYCSDCAQTLFWGR